MLLRLLAGSIGAIFGIVVAFIVDLTVGNGVELIPISKFFIPLIIGGIVGFFIGFIFYKTTGRIFGLLGRFGIEVSP